MSVIRQEVVKAIMLWLSW